MSTWLPTDWQHPTRVELPTGQHLRPIRADETELIGCVYVDPTDKPGGDADISWWVRDEYVGRDLSWEDWIALPRG